VLECCERREITPAAACHDAGGGTDHAVLAVMAWSVETLELAGIAAIGRQR
jgi:hypothetical protein